MNLMVDYTHEFHTIYYLQLANRHRINELIKTHRDRIHKNRLHYVYKYLLYILQHCKLFFFILIIKLIILRADLTV